MSISFICQARLGSSRLPCKVLLPFGSSTILGFICSRIMRKFGGDSLVIATTEEKIDDIIVRYCAAIGVKVYRGSSNNVLQRYHDAALSYKFENVVRLTADNPLIDLEAIDRLYSFHTAQKMEYSSSIETMPVGMGSEIFSLDALRKSLKRADNEAHLEHVNEYILENWNEFKASRFKPYEEDYDLALNLSIDTPEDYLRVEEFYSKNTSLTS